MKQQCPYYENNEWIDAGDYLFLKKGIAKNICLHKYVEECIIKEDKWNIHRSSGRLIKKGKPVIQLSKYFQLVTIIYSPDAIGGKLINTRTRRILAERSIGSKKSEWTWNSFTVSKSLTIKGTILTRGCMLYFVTELKPKPKPKLIKKN